MESEESREIGDSVGEKANPCALGYVREIDESILDSAVNDCISFLFIYLFIYGCVGSSFLCEGFL